MSPDEESMTMSTQRNARLDMRLSAEALATIREAAAVQQQDVTSFVLGAAMDRAREVLINERVLVLSSSEATRLESALDSEPRVVPELARLIEDVRGLKRASSGQP
ncbi:MAG: DUF1778 domain-containing protein [Micrococcales bacterium]|nr:DUF1778 domain-containing protein [Micrococcales bacterium]MCL2666533.1 DUF1778 domain-containing protein [Micrococcales bacterium]